MLKNENVTPQSPEFRKFFSLIKQETLIAIAGGTDSETNPLLRTEGLLVLYPDIGHETLPPRPITLCNVVQKLMQYILVSEVQYKSPGQLINVLVDTIGHAIEDLPLSAAGISVYMGGVMSIVAELKEGPRKAALLKYSHINGALIEQSNRVIEPPVDACRFWPNPNSKSELNEDITNYLRQLLSATLNSIEEQANNDGEIKSHKLELTGFSKWPSSAQIQTH